MPRVPTDGTRGCHCYSIFKEPTTSGLRNRRYFPLSY